MTHFPALTDSSTASTRVDVDRLAKSGANAILVGESLMKDGDIRAKAKELLG